MQDIKLLKAPFNISEIRHAPAFLAPYSFVISMPHNLTLICPTSETPKDTIKIVDTCSCFVVEEDTPGEVIKSTNALEEILGNAHVGTNVMLLGTCAFVFVGTNDAMNVVMLLSSMGYEVKYSDLI